MAVNQKKTKGELTKSKILNIARYLFWKNNFQSITVDKICEEASVNKATFYRYFKSKHELAIAVIESNTQEIVNGFFGNIFSKVSDPVKRLDSIFHEMYKFHKNSHSEEGVISGCPLINFAMELATNDEKIRAKLQESYKIIRKYYAEIYKQALEMGLTNAKYSLTNMAARLNGIMSGALVAAKVENDPNVILDALASAKSILGVSSEIGSHDLVG